MIDQPLVLWDIDGTLVDTGGAGVEPLCSAIERYLKIKPVFKRQNLAGKTDFEIIQTVSGLTTSKLLNYRKFHRVLNSYSKGLEINLENNPVNVLGNVESTLQSLKSLKINSGLLSGNCLKGGHIKLESGGLDSYFDFSTSFFSTFRLNTRKKILEQALSRHRRVILVGDTPNDVEAARTFNVPVISVATGFYGTSELEEINAGLVLDKNWSTERFLEILDSILKSDFSYENT